jgi:hypothetical protein
MSLTYRCYRLDGAGHIHEPEWFEAATDEEAAAQVRAKYPDSRFEIWQGARLAVKGSSTDFNRGYSSLQQRVEIGSRG